MNDSEIIHLYRQGQTEKAFRAIVDTYSERLYWHVRHFLGSHEDTDDLMQEIFIKVWNSLPSFRGDSQLYTWLYRIASNESLNFLSKRKVRAAIDSQAQPLEIARGVDADPFFDGDKAQRALAKAVTTLPDKQRQVFSMKYFDELPYEEMSAILGTSIGALKASYHFAVQKIRAYVEKNCE